MRGASLALLGTRVARPVVLEEGEGSDLEAQEKVLSIAMVRCRQCEGRFRLLPADVLPRKHYGVAVIARLASAHVQANKSLRAAAWTTHTGVTPAHSTLHAWTEGLGAHVLGRPFGSLPEATAFSTVLATTAARWPSLSGTTLPQPDIDPRRHRSQERRERLVAVAGVLMLAVIVLAAMDLPKAPATSAAALCEWRRLAIEFGLAASFAFRTGIAFTRIEHRDPPNRQSAALPKPNGDPRCPTRTRSPPGDSNRSLPTSIPPSTSPDGDA